MECDWGSRSERSAKEIPGDVSVDAELEEISDACEITVHPSEGLPLPFGIEEKPDEVIFIDPSSGEGKRILSDPETGISELFALLRQFVTPVCNNIGLVVNEMLDRNTGVNDIDITTGMTMLHYVVRAECISTDKHPLTEALGKLLLHGADVSQKTMLTDMNAFHIAAFFNCPESLEILISEAILQNNADYLINSPCDEFDCGSPLHLAAANLSTNAVEILLKHGADKFQRDDLCRTPENCIPKRLEAMQDKKKADRLSKIFRSKNGYIPTENNVDNGELMKISSTERRPNAEGGVFDTKQGLSIGDTVLVGGSKRGGIRFIGPTKFAPGVWCGVELDERVGKNDGSINGVRYFTCERTRGVFAPIGTVVRARADFVGYPKEGHAQTKSKGPQKFQSPKMPSSLPERSKKEQRLEVGITAYIDHLKVEGMVRYVGETDFAPGMWVGLSLRRPLGKNNGTVQGREYFRCKAGHGIMLRPSRVSVNGKSGEAIR